MGLTVGIVGGIVIGQASVEASLTSNVLIIIVALSALSSFTAPIYRIGNTIRVIRFPFIISAHLLGLLGIVLTSSFLLVRLLRTESLRRPYLFPFLSYTSYRLERQHYTYANLSDVSTSYFFKV
ncbi:spore germination protein [Bacillus cereus]